MNLPQVGDKYRIDYGEGHWINKLIHIRAIVDGEYIVYRYWKRGNWEYRMTDPTFFEVGLESGHIKEVKHAKRKKGQVIRGATQGVACAGGQG